jgi:predicted branched-subunit amino acid permease
MPDLVKMYIRQCAIGFLLSAIFVGLLLYFNVVNLWHLVTHTDVGILAIFLMWLFNGIVFAGVQFGIAIMLMKYDDDDDDDDHRGRPIHLTPIRVEATAPRGQIKGFSKG